VKLYNSLSKQTELFVPIKPSSVGMYVCGPTVYDRAHLGNARSAVVFDMVYRVLLHSYPSVTYVRNFTDVDDKINAAAVSQYFELEPVEAIRRLTDRTIDLYHQDMDHLNVLRPTHEPRASQYIAEMQTMIEDLVNKSHAYANNGTVFFSVESLPEALRGVLSNRKIGAGAEFGRLEANHLKQNPDDFVLWKPSNNNEPSWPSAWGAGRPGWHIECSAMSKSILGTEFDIHGGGEDLMFPHHENEIAQSGASCNHKPHARFWLHNGMVLINGKKMSKSLGNFLIVEDVSAHMSGAEIRLALLSTHYRSALNWSDNLVTQTKNMWKKFSAVEPNNEPASTDVVNALKSDFNVPLALSYIHKEVKQKSKSAYGALKLLGLVS
jgi:cysteinyl-tRNA synthetase